MQVTLENIQKHAVVEIVGRDVLHGVRNRRVTLGRLVDGLVDLTPKGKKRYEELKNGQALEQAAIVEEPPGMSRKPVRKSARKQIEDLMGDSNGSYSTD